MRQGNSKQKSEERSHIPARLNFLFFIVFVLFVSLILRLAYLQIIKGNDYRAIVERTEETIATNNVPRGEIYDASGRRLVKNESKSTITYTRGPKVSSDDIAEVAIKLSQYIALPHTTALEQESDYDLSLRDLQDYYIATHSEEIYDRLSDKEKNLDGSKAYDAELKAVSEDDIKAFNDQELTSAAIYKKMSSGYALTTSNIKINDVTDGEIALVSENLRELPGVNIGVDWERTYPLDNLLRSVLGSVSSESEGIPSDKKDTYLAQGYALNDRVGISNLEKQYESVLKGAKSKSAIEVNQKGEIISQEATYPGQKGSNLILNIDAGFQSTIEDLATDYLKNYQQGLNDSIYIVAMDPRNGDLLAMVGKEIDKQTGKVSDDALGSYTKAFESGSVVKGATVASAFMDGVLDSSNEVIVDAPLYVAGTPAIRSLFNQSGSVTLNTTTALERSSNIYMAKLAMRMGGVWSHENGQALSMDGNTVIDKFRYYFSQFGLGVATGIDLPGEQVGFKGTVSSPGQALYYSFGQFDSFTALQLAQYVSTIANGGVRYAPRVISEIRGTAVDGSLGEVETEVEPKIMNTVNIKPEQLKVIQQGFYQVVHGSKGTARNYFQGAAYEAAGKTGTAEALYFGSDKSQRGTEVINRTFAAYAPYDNPEIAISVVVPYLPASNSNYHLNEVARDVLDAYFREGSFKNLNETIGKELPLEDEEKDTFETDNADDNAENIEESSSAE